MERKKPCALSYANGVHVGGGYTDGKQGQEEDLCRQFPSYYASLIRAKDQCYPFGPPAAGPDGEEYSDVLWTPIVQCLRAGEDQGYRVLEKEERFRTDFIAAAAPDGEVWDDAGVYNTMFNIFFAPKWADKDISVLVIGAWGCGTRYHDPRKVCNLFCQVIRDHDVMNLYDEVCFAVPTCPGSDTDQVYEKLLRAHFGDRLVKKNMISS